MAGGGGGGGGGGGDNLSQSQSAAIEYLTLRHIPISQFFPEYPF